MEEIWKDIEGYKGSYQVSNLGGFKKDGILQKGYISSGYKCFSLTKDGVRKAGFIHKLMAQAFIPNPKNYKVVNHKNGVKTDNFLDNFEWCNKSHDVKEAYRLGLLVFKGRKGESNPMHKLSDFDILLIRKELSSGKTQKEITRDFRISQAQVSFIKNNKRRAL